MKEAPRGRLLSSLLPLKISRWQTVFHAGASERADRPMAHRLFQREDARPLIERDDKLLERRGLGIELSLVVRLERDIAARAEHKRWRAVLARHVRAPRPRA